MTRTPISLPTRLQLLNFFLVVDNVVKSVIARLQEGAEPAEFEDAAQELSEDILETITDLSEDIAALRDDIIQKKQQDASFLLALAALKQARRTTDSFAWPFASPSNPEPTPKSGDTDQ